MMSEKADLILTCIIFINLEVYEIQKFDIVGKDGHRAIPKIRLLNLQNHGDGINIFQKTWNGNLVLVLLKPRSRKPQNQEIQNQQTETKKLFHFQVRDSPAPLVIPTPTPAPDHPLEGHEWAPRISVSPCGFLSSWFWNSTCKFLNFEKVRATTY